MSERGSGTVLGLAVIAVTIVLTVAVGALAGVTAARGAAQTAADLAAVAAAQRLHGTGSAGAACELATVVVQAHEVRLESCTVHGTVVEVRTSRLAGPGLTARATARAGPAGAAGPARTEQLTGPAGTTGPARAGQVTGPATLASTTITGPARGPPRLGASRPQRGQASTRKLSTVTAPALSSGALPLPHLGDWTQLGQPSAQAQPATASRVAASQLRAARKPRSANPAPPG